MRPGVQVCEYLTCISRCVYGCLIRAYSSQVWGDLDDQTKTAGFLKRFSKRVSRNIRDSWASATGMAIVSVFHQSSLSSGYISALTRMFHLLDRDTGKKQ